MGDLWGRGRGEEGCRGRGEGGRRDALPPPPPPPPRAAQHRDARRQACKDGARAKSRKRKKESKGEREKEEGGAHWNMIQERKMSIQSLITPAMFMVRAEVLPISRNTAMLRAGARVGGVGGERGG